MRKPLLFWRNCAVESISVWYRRFGEASTSFDRILAHVEQHLDRQILWSEHLCVRGKMPMTVRNPLWIYDAERGS